MPWIAWVRRRRLPGQHPYRALWLAGCVYWLLTIAWIRLAHPANYLALLLLASYLGGYLPLFVAIARQAVHRHRAPLWLACPVAWTGLEWVRAHFLTGFLMGSLAHTQTSLLPVIQIADLLGEYGVSFLILMVAASLQGTLAPADDSCERWLKLRSCWWTSLFPGMVGLGCAIGYGYGRLSTTFSDGFAPIIGLVQGDSLADWKGSAEKERQIMAEHWELSLLAAQKARSKYDAPPDLIVWPETMFRQPLWTLAPGDAEMRSHIGGEVVDAAHNGLQRLVRETGSAILVGIDRFVPRQAGSGTSGGASIQYDDYNSSVAVDRAGNLAGAYDKRHLLPFGEYIPFVDLLPFLRNYSPITGLTRPGHKSEIFILDGVRYGPNICYESALPHLIRRQVAELTARGDGPDVLTNLTNDAWYWGSSELDMHLACDVFRAIETRTPMVVAANRGLSAAIDANGRILAVSRRNRPEAVVVRVPLAKRMRTADQARSFYVASGDWFAIACVVGCVASAASGLMSRRQESLLLPLENRDKGC